MVVYKREKEMAPHSSTLAWKIPWTDEPGSCGPWGCWVGHNWATSLSLFPFTHWRRKWQPTPVFLPEESRWTEEENAPVIANTLFQQHKRRLYPWTSTDGQHRNQIDYILCSQRWRNSIQSAETRLGADCGSHHELLIAKFRLKLKKVGKTRRPFKCDLNQIP